jgi:signal transduction histidine kinase
VVDGAVLRLAIRDDGVGGPRSDRGSGVLGLRDPAAAVDGDLRVESAPGAGTLVAARLPMVAHA